MRCLYCGGELISLRNRGWVHMRPDGTPGGAYVMRCRRCGYKETSASRSERCPRCVSRNAAEARPEDWRDDHCAAPDRRAGGDKR